MIEYSYTQGVQEYSKEMDESARQKYVNKVYSWLQSLKPGTKFLVERMSKSETRNLFIEVVKMYIDEVGGDKVEFSEDYTYIKSLQPWLTLPPLKNGTPAIPSGYPSSGSSTQSKK